MATPHDTNNLPATSDASSRADVDLAGGFFSAFDQDTHDSKLDGRLVDAGYWLTILPEVIDAIIEGLFEKGDKVAIFGKSKTRKSFFALMLAFCMALGLDFLGLNIGRRRIVLLIQLEIKASHMHRRVRNMAFALGVKSVDGLHILNGRGMVIDQETIIELAKSIGAEVVIIDPIYKLNTGDESAEPLAAIMAMFDAITEATGATVVYVHHDKKGSSGDLDLVDRGSGSGIVGRDYDTAFFLTPHVDGDAVVLEFITRNHPPRDGIVARFEDGCFVADDTASPTVETSATQRNRRSKGESITELANKAKDMIEIGSEVNANSFRVRLTEAFDIGQHKARDVIRLLSEMDGFSTGRTSTFPSHTTIKRA